MRKVKYIYLVFLGVLAGMMCITYIAQAAPLGPTFVPGKEYSDELDIDAAGVLDDMQNILWDGAGGVADATDYNGAGGTSTFDNDQVDAIANRTDFLFPDVTANAVPILFSERIGPDSPDAGSTDTAAPIYFEETGGAKGTWATSAQVNADPTKPHNLDGLEIWGGVDADRFSLFGDSISGTSVYLDDGFFTPYIGHAEIAGVAMGLLASQSITGVLESEIDIDAMMLFDIGANDLWEVGDKIMFSLWSVTGTGLKGDGVYVYTKGGPAITLFHGGHLWSEGWNGDINIDALEAVFEQGTTNVPEPSTIALLGIGLAGLGGGYLRRRRRQKQEIIG